MANKSEIIVHIIHSISSSIDHFFNIKQKIMSTDLYRNIKSALNNRKDKKTQLKM